MTTETPLIDLGASRTIGQILAAALRIFSRSGLLFILLTAIVMVPYAVATALIPSPKHIFTGTDLISALADLAIVNPFIVAMQMQVLIDLGDGRRPRMADVLRRGSRVLPVVVAAAIVAGLPALLGLIAPVLLIPGAFVGVRLVVAAPAAATLNVSWLDAVKLSFRLTRGNAWRVFGLLVMQTLLTLLVASLVGSGSPSVVIVWNALAGITQSFFTLAIALLYFDLRAREAGSVASG